MSQTSQNPLTPTSESTRVIVSSAICLGILVAIVGARAIYSGMWRRRFGLDDLFLILATASGIAESGLMGRAAQRGLGTNIRPGNALLYQRMDELVYASDLFFLIAIFFAKLSVVRLVYRLASPAAIAKGRIMILQILIVVWAAFSGPAIAFQCSAELPWLYTPDRCVGRGALWYPTLLISIFTDIWLAGCVWSTIPELQIRPKQRQIALGLFATRISACLFCIVQLALLAPALNNINQALALPTTSVFKQLTMCASIVCAALPVLYKCLGTYVHQPTGTATMYTNESDKQPTPLSDIRQPEADATKKEFSVSESETKDAPKLGNPDFSSSFSLAFNKEIEVSTRV